MIKDKIGYIKFNSFYKLTPESKSKYIEMFKKIENAQALIFDLLTLKDLLLSFESQNIIANYLDYIVLFYKIKLSFLLLYLRL